MIVPLTLLACALLVLPVRASAHLRLRELGGDVAQGVSAPGSNDDDPHSVATTFDLLAACLRAGLPMATAAAAVASTAPRQLSFALRRASELLTLGAEPATAWADAAADPSIESLARMARRSARSGSSLAAAMTELAIARRIETEDAAAAKAERAGVLISGPLGLCFLPAFICLGIVPVVIGLATKVLDGGLL
ncbi:type II secretion system F family protein [Antrihabitans sp. YC3-6]|uniref:Type II secretion system F family protein n=1 Tax=Antrihabitans stalagmiti TaxID=2799499 RepID=A0A934NRY6_9NOCA|nr:type II secretion system F family protein [Antrihabitans stalagmiti]MBJ8340147.1 type II secretion system F family protein [Antrihabitans stalagmiti]